MPKEMEVVIPVCAGVDIHKEVAVCCVRKTKGEEVQSEVRSFSTMTEGLRALRDWLLSVGCTHVAVESTGVYWKPMFNILEESFTVILANARHVKHVPGRKTDVKDCEWLAKLLQCGLIKGSFIPPKPIRELRDLTRYRKQLVGDLSAEKNRVQKILEDTNIKFSSVATNVFSVSGMKILEALTEGETDGESLAQLAVGKLKSKAAELAKSLDGHVSSHHLFMIKRSLDHIAYLQKSLKKLDGEIQRKMTPYKQDYQRLQTIPGVKEIGAASIVAEIGVDMSVFPTSQHLSSWAGMCPGNNESAGKKKSGKARPGNQWLKTTLVEASRAASRKKDSYFREKYHRLASRRGKKRAAVAIGHKILVAAYHIIKEKTKYRELGADYLDQKQKGQLKKYWTKKLEKLGFQVNLSEADGDAHDKIAA